jgi:MraZ protein
MFIGRYYHRLEEKGRLSLPKTFREKSSDWIVTRGLDGGLFLFKPETFESKIAELSERTFTKKRHRDFVRYLVNDARHVSVDKQGRVLLPDYLTTFAQLNKEVVVVGSYQYIEIWDQEKYHTYLDTLEKNGENLAEEIEDI